MGEGTEMPRYRCHKIVHALRITGVRWFDDGSGGKLSVEDGYPPIIVDRNYLLKHDPHVGGYYVIYEGGYASWSPATAFESGYTRI